LHPFFQFFSQQMRFYFASQISVVACYVTFTNMLLMHLTCTA
jgi:hypothetical protein